MERYSDAIEARLSPRHLKSLELARPFSGKSVLNIGCYNGWLESFAVKEGAKRVVGVDKNQKYVDLAAKNVPSAEFVQASVLELPFEENAFDTVCLFEVLEHLPKGKEPLALSEIRRVLKKGGRVILSVPNWSLVGNLLDPAWYFGHRHYSEKSLSQIVEKCGFTIKRIERKGGVWQIVTTILLYLFKKIFSLEIPFKRILEDKKSSEYLEKDGFVTTFYTAIKPA